MKFLVHKINHGCAYISNANVPISSDSIDCGVITSGFTEITMECWLKVMVINSGIKGVFTNFYHSPAMGGITIWVSNSSVNIRTGDGVTSNTSIGDISTSIDTSKWNHIAITYNGTVLRKYLNADLVAESTRMVTFGNYKTLIGKWADSVNNYIFEGFIDEARVWSYARSVEQLKASYKSVLQPQPGLKGYWRLNGNALDSSGNGNNAIPHSGVAWSDEVAPQIYKYRPRITGQATKKIIVTR